jgi:hypothetical protein
MSYSTELTGGVWSITCSCTCPETTALFPGLTRAMTSAHATAENSKVSKALAQITPKSFGV